jgi:predicted SprT family Zn-dependent metalloprotease
LPFVLDWCPAQFARSRRNNANRRGMFASVCAVVFLLPFVLDGCPAQFARSRRNNANRRGMFASVCAVFFFNSRVVPE